MTLVIVANNYENKSSIYPWKYKKLTVSLALISIPMSDILLSRKFHVSSKSGDLSLTMYNSEI